MTVNMTIKFLFLNTTTSKLIKKCYLLFINMSPLQTWWCWSSEKYFGPHQQWDRNWGKFLRVPACSSAHSILSKRSTLIIIICLTIISSAPSIVTDTNGDKAHSTPRANWNRNEHDSSRVTSSAWRIPKDDPDTIWGTLGKYAMETVNEEASSVIVWENCIFLAS